MAWQQAARINHFLLDGKCQVFIHRMLVQWLQRFDFATINPNVSVQGSANVARSQSTKWSTCNGHGQGHTQELSTMAHSGDAT